VDFILQHWPFAANSFGYKVGLSTGLACHRNRIHIGSSVSWSLEMWLRIDLCAFLLDIGDGWTLNRPLPKSSGWSASSPCQTPDR